MGQLVVVGSGIKSVAHLSQETILVIKQASKVLYLVNEPLMKEWIERECKLCQSLDNIYFGFEKRGDAYQAMTDFILSEYEQCPNLCVIFYGHPVMFASSAMRAVHAIKKKNADEATILPAISTLDCLFADLALDPGVQGCFSVNALDFLIYKKKFDLSSELVLLQLGNLAKYGQSKAASLQVLQKYLQEFYPESHELCLYEASQYPRASARIDFFPLSELDRQAVSGISTLYIPALHPHALDFDMLAALDMQVVKVEI